MKTYDELKQEQKPAGTFDSTQARAEHIVRERLKHGPLSVEEIIDILSEENISFSRRRGKEIAWKMAEEGQARFNSEWSLELQD